MATKREKKKARPADVVAEGPLVPDLIEVDVPAGGRLMVVSDLHLSQTSTDASESLSTELVREIDAWDGPGAVVLAGDCFELLAESHLDPGRALLAHPRFTSSLLAFSEGAGHRVVVLPGNHDGCLAWHKPAVATLRKRLGAELALAADVTLHTGEGPRKVRIEHGHRFDADNAFDDPRNPGETPLGHHVVRALSALDKPGAEWLNGLELLADTRNVGSFISSRLLYRRLVRRFGWLLLPLLVSFVALVVAIVARMGHHPSITHRAVSIAADFGLAGVAILAVIALVSVLWWLSVRGPLKALSIGELSACDVEEEQNDPARAFAGRLVSEGHAGLITGHTHEAELADLGRGFYANTGCGGSVAVERPGRFGFPPAWVVGRQQTFLELEAGARLHARLHYARQQPPTTTFLERLLTRPAHTDTPRPEIVASWPEGDTFPPHEPHGLERKRARRIGAFALAIGGLIDLISAVTPPVRPRLHAVTDIIPLAVSQAAAVFVVLSGLALLLLARGVRRGQRHAWLVAEIVLWTTFGLHVVKGLDLEEAIVAAAIALYLLANRRHFRVQADDDSTRRGLIVLLGGMAACVVVGVLAVKMLPGHANRHIGWWRATHAVSERLVGISSIPIGDRMDDFLSPTLLAVSIGLGLYVGWLLFRPVVAHRLMAPAPEAAERARRLVAQYGGDTLAYFALRDDKRWFFHGDTLVAYAVTQGVALVSPDPIGPVADRRRAWFAFRQYADDHGWPVAVMGASEDFLPIYHAAGMHEMYVGDEAVVDVRRFNLDGGRNKGLRQAVNRIAKYGYRMEFHDPAHITPELEASLRGLMTESRRGEMERGFSMTLGRIFSAADEGLLLAVCFGPDGTPAAFCQYVPAPAIQGYSLDLMRRSEREEHPNGLTDYVVVETMNHLREQGMVGLGLNFATMRGVLAGERGDGLSKKVERWFYRKMSDSMQIESLWKYNDKFDPDWVPRYACYDSPEHMLASAAALAKAESWWEIPVIGRFFQPDAKGSSIPALPDPEPDELPSRVPVGATPDAD
jgi:lysylphosphatidylglycerol synthetase-like protein (DUF2156 family)/UDP-2,3-diacylglucosamine pyrophosphatase LpxH